MKTKSITIIENIKPALMIEFLAKLTFMFFLVNELFSLV